MKKLSRVGLVVAATIGLLLATAETPAFAEASSPSPAAAAHTPLAVSAPRFFDTSTAGSGELLFSFEDIKATALEVFEELSAADDPQAVFGELTSVERASFDSYFLPVSEEVSITLTRNDELESAVTYTSFEEALASLVGTNACYGGYVRYTMYAALGNAIWDTYTEGDYCGNGSVVTVAAFTGSWSTIAALGWRDAGLVGSGFGVVTGAAKIWSQRKMVLGVNGWDVQTVTPCLRMNGNVNGTATTSHICSIYG